MLNLGGVPNLSSQDLRGLLPNQDETSDVNPTPTPRLESLTLSNTGVDNEAAIYISTCRNLEALALENTRFTSCVASIEQCTFRASADVQCEQMKDCLPSSTHANTLPAWT